MAMGSYNVVTLLSSQNFVTYEKLEIRICPEIGFESNYLYTLQEINCRMRMLERTGPQKSKYFCKLLSNSTTLCELRTIQRKDS
jgi:hypothetical protein